MTAITEWFRSWRLVSWRSAVVAAVVLYALIGFFLVPWIVKSQIEKQSLKILKRQATVEKVRCNPFTLSLTIEGFSLPDRPGSVLLAWDRFYANAQVSSLFRWAATLKELRISNPHVALRRFEDGKVNVLEVMEDLDTGEPKPKEEGLPRALLQHVQVVDGRIEIDDRHRPEPLLWEVGPSQIELFDICTIPNREGSNEVELRLPGGGLLKVDGTVVVEPLGLDGTLVLENNSLTSSWRAVEYLFEFDLTSGTIDLDLNYQVGLEEDGPHLTVDGADLRITDYGLRWEGHDIDLLQVDSINVLDGETLRAFQSRLLRWFRTNGRDLPWRKTRDPYKILVSEVMLQQTQVDRVRGYYERFLREYRTVRDLATAHPARVREAWEGLGYYARARNLHAAAREVAQRHDGQFPRRLAEVMALPGVGRYTAGAVLSFAYGEPAPVLDTNVRRVLSRVFVRRRPASPAQLDRRLWALAKHDSRPSGLGVQPGADSIRSRSSIACASSTGLSSATRP